MSARPGLVRVIEKCIAVSSLYVYGHWGKKADYVLQEDLFYQKPITSYIFCKWTVASVIKQQRDVEQGDQGPCLISQFATEEFMLAVERAQHYQL